MADKFETWRKRDTRHLIQQNKYKLKNGDLVPDVPKRPLSTKSKNPDVNVAPPKEIKYNRAGNPMNFWPGADEGKSWPLTSGERKEYNKLKSLLPKKYAKAFGEEDFKQRHRFTIVSASAPSNKTGESMMWSEQGDQQKVESIKEEIDAYPYVEQMRKTKKASRLDFKNDERFGR
jgi:hypothetical protein